jgi:hypothetical protein
MSSINVRVCQCPPGPAGEAHPDRARHAQRNRLLRRLAEAERRGSAAVAANRLGRGGGRRGAQLTGLAEPTLRRGQEAVAGTLASEPAKRPRRSGDGRPPVERQIRLA